MFPSANLDDLTLSWNVIRNCAAEIKRKTTSLSNAAASTNVSGQQIITYLQEIISLKTMMQQHVTNPGLLPYVREQINDPSVNISAEWTTMTNAITATIDWIRTNFPKDASGYLLYEQLDPSGLLILRTFTPAMLTGLVSQLNTLSATIS